MSNNLIERRLDFKPGRRSTDGKCHLHEDIEEAMDRLSEARITDTDRYLPRWVYIATVGFFLTSIGLYITLSLYNMSTFKAAMDERLKAEVTKSEVLMSAHNLRVDAALKSSDEKYQRDLNRIYAKTDDNSKSLENLSRTVVKIETLQNKVLTTLDRFQDSFDRLGHENGRAKKVQ